MLPPIIILVEPQLGENIGSACRAMLNFNVNTLRLVNPRDSWPNPAANALSAGALEDKNFNVSLFNSLNEATKDISYLLATSARHRDMNKPVYDTTKAIFNVVQVENSGLTTGIMFGGEKSEGFTGFEGFEDFKFNTSTGVDISQFDGIDLSGVTANNDTISYSKGSGFGF